MKPAIVSLALGLVVTFAVGGFAACTSSESPPAGDAGASPDGFSSGIDAASKADGTTTALDSAVPLDSGPQVDSSTAADAPADAPVDAALLDAAAPADAEGDASDAGTDGASVGPFCEGVCGEPNCGTCPDAATIATSDAFQQKDFNLDAYEVDNAMYAAFLAAHVDPASQPVFCAWNASFVPSAGWPATGRDAYPVDYVDWCDAYAYCAWAGRRLCGNIGGGSNNTVYSDNGDQSQWFRGCTAGQGGTSVAGYIQYPYANAYDPTTCNGDGYGAGALISVGSATNCVGGLSGLFDMSGNVSEWEDSCWDNDQSDAGPEAGPTSVCAERGGSFEDDAGGLECVAAVLAARTTTAVNIGFRCCSR